MQARGAFLTVHVNTCKHISSVRWRLPNARPFALLCAVRLGADVPRGVQVAPLFEAFVTQHATLLAKEPLHRVCSCHAAHLVQASLIDGWHAVHCLKLLKGEAFELPCELAQGAPEPAAEGVGAGAQGGAGRAAASSADAGGGGDKHAEATEVTPANTVIEA